MSQLPAANRETTFPRSDEADAVIFSPAGRLPSEPLAPAATRDTAFPRSRDVEPAPERRSPSAERLSEEQLAGDEEQLARTWDNNPSKDRALFHSTPQKRPSAVYDLQGKRQATAFCKAGSPWKTYDKFVVLGASGATFLAQAPPPSPDIVVIREQRVPEIGITRKLISTSHPNVVTLRDAFVDPTFVYLVYDRMEISLPRLRSDAQLGYAHIATICKEVLQGLLYIHEVLQVTYTGSLYKNVFLDLSGSVKIGNIGTNLLTNNAKQFKSSAHPIAKLLLHIMQPGTMCRLPDEMSLSHPENYDKSIVQFQEAAKSSSVEEIQEHTFLDIAMPSRTLVPLVWKSSRKTRLVWSAVSS